VQDSRRVMSSLADFNFEQHMVRVIVTPLEVFPLKGGQIVNQCM
jgi:hypothetical protein